MHCEVIFTLFKLCNVAFVGERRFVFELSTNSGSSMACCRQLKQAGV